MRHHTKDKGDIGVAKAFTDLTVKGFLVLLPTTEHAPFDLVAYRDEEFLRVQVKYRSARTGAIEVDFRSGWTDRHGVHKKLMDKALVDVVCVYCPETDECYYVRPQDHGMFVTLRVAPSKNRQKLRVLLASDHREVPLPVRVKPNGEAVRPIGERTMCTCKLDPMEGP